MTSTFDLWNVTCTSDLPIRSNLEAKFKLFHSAPQCGTELIQYVTLQFRDRCRAALLHYKRCTENAIFMCEQWPIWYDFHVGIEWFSFECRKTKTKVITLANHIGHRQYIEPIKTRSNYMRLTQSAGKCMRACHNWLWFYF